eukprot:GILI01022369.1.p1 GENE.GILI01022369.1~~GILI01022369.1.p1  ORF type:complete len:282 (-),score=40.64 GILI01022369.1:62-907(-)
MKFKTHVKDPRTLAAICATSKALNKRCILKLHAQRLRFISNNASRDGSQVWTSCKTDAFLGDMKIESRRDNEIFLEVPDLTQIISALKCAEASSNVLMRLAKADNAEFLRFTMHNRASHHDISHDVIVRVLTEAELSSVVAPPLESRLLQVYLPSLQDVASFVDKVRNNGCVHITVTVTLLPLASDNQTQMATLTFVADSFVSSFVLHYPSVEIGPAHRQDNALQKASCTIETKLLAKFVTVKEVAPMRMVAHVVDGKALVISAFAAGDTNIVYYMPSQLL